MAQTKTAAVKKSAAQAEVLGAKDLGLTKDNRCKVSEQNFACAIRCLLQNWRQGTVSCKGRSDVALTNKKPWKQKGTGRARAGSARSPIWRGGGVTFGPQKREKKYSISQSVRKTVMNNLLWDRIDSKAIVSLSWEFSGDKPQASFARKVLKNANLLNKKITLFVEPHDHIAHASFSNFPNVQLLLFDQPNAYALAYGDCWVVLEQNRDSFKEMVRAWI